MTQHTNDPLLNVANKTVLITAAASGMGRAAALLFGARGAHVIAVDAHAASLSLLAIEMRTQGSQVFTIVADLTDVTAVHELITKVQAHTDVIDVLYNHAGLRGAPGMTYDAESLRATTTINLFTPMLLTQGLLPQLTAADSASLIYTSSISGLGASAGLITYGATKAGLINYAKSVAVELGPLGIRANVICPGATESAGFARNNDQSVRDAILQHIPLRRIGQPEDDAAVALFLASDASRYVTGTVIPVDGGMSA